MRSLETKMRYAKDKQIAVKNIKDSEVAERTARHYDKLLEKYEKIYQGIANQTGVTPRPERAYVPGYKGKLPQVKPQSQKLSIKNDNLKIKNNVLNQSNSIEELKKEVAKLTDGLGTKSGGNGIPMHNEPKFIKTIDFSDVKAIKKELSKFENDAISNTIETACVITNNGEVYYCYGVEDRVFPDYDLNEKLYGAIISHNLPIAETAYTFSEDDLQLFMQYKLKVLRGFDEKYTYELIRDASQIDDAPEDWMKFENFEHSRIIEKAKEYGIGYKRWLSE